MRLSLWIGLILAFSAGMCCALVMRALYFEAKPEVIRVQGSEPTTQILVATKPIPGGIEITADFVAFLDVPLSEIPVGAHSDFNKIYRRQPASPIPVGCPICEDLLLPLSEAAAEATFIPPGSRFVTLDIVHLRQGHMVFSPIEPLATILEPRQRIDLRLVSRNETPGRLAELKNQVLQTFSTYDFRNSGELILENIPIHQIQRRAAAEHAGMPRESLVLVLDKSEADKLAAAARKGRIRVLAHRNEDTVAGLADIIDVFEDVFEVAQLVPNQSEPSQSALSQSASSPQPLTYSDPSLFEPQVFSAVLPLQEQEAAVPPPVPFAQEQQELPQASVAELTSVVLMGDVRKIASDLTPTPSPEPASIPVPVHLAVPIPIADSVHVPVVRIPQHFEPHMQHSAVSALPALNEREASLRNEVLGDDVSRNEVSRIAVQTLSPQKLSVEPLTVHELAESETAGAKTTGYESAANESADSLRAELASPRPNTQSIQFVTPVNSVAIAPPTRTSPRNPEKQAAAVISPGTSFVTTSLRTAPQRTASQGTSTRETSPVTTSLSLVLPTAPMPQERLEMQQGRSLIERRAYRVPPSDHSGETFSDELRAPPLLKNSSAGGGL